MGDLSILAKLRLPHRHGLIRGPIIVLFMLLVALRIPAVLMDGRFWAEEGVIFYREAWYSPWPDALFTVHTGYLNMVASAATLLALHLVPLEQAPLVSACVALVVQTLPAIILATSQISWLQRGPAFAVALILLLIPSGDAEVWLNSITSQFHLALCVGLILAADIRGGFIGLAWGLILLLAPLAGPVGGILVPLFLARAYLERSRGRLVQAVLLGAPVLVQAVIILTHPEPARTIGIGLPLLLSVIGIQNVILPMVGAERLLQISRDAYTSFEQSGIAIMPIAVAVLGVGGLAITLFRRGDRAALWLFAGACTLAAVSYSTELTHGDPLYLLLWPSGRYAFAPTVLFSLSLLGLAATGSVGCRTVPALLILWMIDIATGPYFEVSQSVAHGANWKAEVAAWRRNPDHTIRVWPLEWQPELTLDPSFRPRN